MLTTTPGNRGRNGTLETKAAPAGNRGLTTTFRLRRDVMAEAQSSRPRPVADIIGPDPAAWFAALTGLPYGHVAQKLAEAEARIAAGVG